ncbi:MAG TPA: energy transducer TonB [Bryobacteraceae bacterium]|nr:energy transducer TonB [Bryobacteraceae bacterium]
MTAAGILLLAAAVSAGVAAGASQDPQPSAPVRRVVDLLPAQLISPSVVFRTEPEYTPAALRAGREGTVLLYVRIGRDGRAHQVRVIRGLGLGLDEKAMEAVRKWRFLPGEKDGVPVVTPATIEVTFRLNKAANRV